MGLPELSEVFLRRDLPEAGLRAGDVGTIVHAYTGGRGYEVEFMTADGTTVAVVSLDGGDVEPLGGHRILNAREISVGHP